MEKPSLVMTINKLAIFGERAGFTIDQMIQMLNAGIGMETLLQVIDSNLNLETKASEKRT